MSTKMTRAGYLHCIRQDVAAIETQMPDSLERDHAIAVLKDSVTFYYPPAPPEPVPLGRAVERHGPLPAPVKCSNRHCEEPATTVYISRRVGHNREGVRWVSPARYVRCDAHPLGSARASHPIGEGRDPERPDA